MSVFSRIFGKRLTQSNDAPMTSTQAVDIINAYGDFLEKSAPTLGCVADVSKLPFPKARISEAILVGLNSATDHQMKEMLKAGYLELANWQEGVGPVDRGIDTSKLGGIVDIEAQARAILAQAEGMDEWNNMVSAELELRIAQLRKKGFGAET